MKLVKWPCVSLVGVLTSLGTLGTVGMGDPQLGQCHTLFNSLSLMRLCANSADCG